MTRLTDKEKLILSHAEADVPFALSGASESVGSALRSVLQAVRRPFLRAAIRHRLERLDDRILEDIGIARWEIDGIADRVASRRTPRFSVAVASMATALLGGFVGWRQRRVATRELMALDDRMLRDIGIARSDIPAVIASFRSAVDSETVAGEADPLEALRRWARSRAAMKELHNLDDRALNDIGMVRGDIDWVAEELAVRSLRPANANHAPKVA